MTDPFAETKIDNVESDDPRLIEAVQAYLAEIEAGRRPLRRTFLARYPELGESLSDCLDGLAFVQSAAYSLQPDDQATAEPVIDPTNARPLGDFKLIKQIGRGGMGVVYEAEQVSLGRRVALKVLPMAAALDSRHLQRFRNESLAAAQLHHTNVVPVYAVGCERSVHYYAMQLIDGQSLADVIKNIKAEGVPTETASSLLATLRSSQRSAFYDAVAELGAQAADGLEYAHRMGIIHRDIKPGNLLLDTGGTLWITDFGLAQLHAGTCNETLTRPGDMLGTLRYMSPEQANGRAVMLDQRTDVYSLGTTLFELLTLTPAIAGQSQLQILKEIQSNDPPSTRAIDSKIPVALELILQRAMAKNPAERYQSAAEFATDLRRFLDRQPIKAKPPTLNQTINRWARRHSRGVSFAAGFMVLATIGLLVATILISRANRQVADALEAESIRAAEAEQAYLQVREVLDMFTRFAAEDLANNPLADDARRAMLNLAMDYYQSFLAKRGENANDAEELVQARKFVNAILGELAASENLRRIGERAQLLGVRQVRDELGLESSRRELEDLRNAFRIEPETLYELSPQQRQIAYEDAAISGEQALEQLLSTDQQKRLNQITWQIQGARALADPQLTQAISLTMAQRNSIDQVITKSRIKWERLGMTRGDKPPPRDGSSSTSYRQIKELELRDNSLADAIAILSIEQRERLSDLIGEPFPRDWIPSNLGIGTGPIFGSPRN